MRKCDECLYFTAKQYFPRGCTNCASLGLGVCKPPVPMWKDIRDAETHIIPCNTEAEKCDVFRPKI